MNDSTSRKQNTLKALALVLGLAVCGIVLGQGFSQKDELISESSSLHTFKEKVKSNKNIIVNTYLLGVSIYKETID